jgi:hypothetical protein
LKHEVVICNKKIIIFVICLDVTNFNVDKIDSRFVDVSVRKCGAHHNMKSI